MVSDSMRDYMIFIGSFGEVVKAVHLLTNEV